jgi:hypothetical protein
MALCVYKRIREEPVRLTINGKPIVVRRGQLVVADNREMMGVSGFAFLKLYEQTDNIGATGPNLVVSRPKPLIEHDLTEMSVQIQEITQQDIKNDLLNHSSVVQEITPPPVVKPAVFVEDKNKPVGFAKETINTLKAFDSKQWFALKKEDIIKFLEDANIEYQHISSDKWELLKFLKKIIKEL